MSLQADWETENCLDCKWHLKRFSLLLGNLILKWTEQEIRCSVRMLPRMILLNPGFTETEAPQEKNHLSENEGQLAEGEEPLRHCLWGGRGRTKTQALSTRKDGGLSLKRAALREKVIKDKEETLPGKLDCGHSYFSFKNGTAINLSDVQVENQPTQFHNSLIQRKTKKLDSRKRLSLLHECSMVTWRDLPIYGTPFMVCYC